MDLGTNRSYLSSFINSEYDMNLSRYINRRRLEELDHLRIATENKNTSGSEMVPDTGFSSYLRIKDEEDARLTIRF
jgi:AraC-like DNA-binding protein